MKATRARYFLYLPLIAAAVFYLIPMYIMVVTGFKAFEEISLQTMWDLPRTLGLDNFREAFKVLSQIGRAHV